MLTAFSVQAIPSSSPIHSGYVEWESKRGKWNKRWLRLREHSLWISKRDNVRGVFFALLLKVHLMYIPHTTGERRDALVFFIQL